MGQISPPPPVKLFAGILTSLPEILPEVEERLTARLWPCRPAQSLLFPSTRRPTMTRKWETPSSGVFFPSGLLIAPAEISSIKRATNDLEAAFAAEHCQVRRPVNLDPGYLEESKIVLASTKNFYHRILLSEGIYGEVTLHFSSGAWQAFPWTFPDFRCGRYDDFFTQLRRIYRDQRKAEAGTGSPGRHRQAGESGMCADATWAPDATRRSRCRSPAGPVRRGCLKTGWKRPGSRGLLAIRAAALPMPAIAAHFPCRPRIGLLRWRTL